MIKDLCFEIIEKCLNNCKFCSSNSNNQKSRIIKFEDFKKTIDYFISSGGIEELSLSGGEPFLHPDLLRMVAYAKSFGIKTVIFTSGVVHGESTFNKKIYLKELDEALNKINKQEADNKFLKEKVKNFYYNLMAQTKYDKIDRKMLHTLKEIGLDKIVFDIEAYELETDEWVMGRASEARQALLDSLLNVSFEGLKIDVHFVPMKPNYKEIIDLLELLEIVKVDQISLLNFLPQGRGKINCEELQLSNEEKQEFFKLLEKGKKYFSGTIRLGIPLQGEETHRCNAGLEKLDIKFNGDVLPCPAFKEITEEECKRFNINISNIYKNLEDIKCPGTGKRVRQLCKQIYGSRTK